MNAKKKYLLLFTVLFLLILVILLLVDKKHLTPHKVSFDEKKYTENFNDWTKSIEPNKTSLEIEIQKKRYADLIVAMSEMAIKNIEFHGLVIDQYGEPVPNVVINYIGSRSFVTNGSGPGATESDIDGRFFIDNARGDGLKIHKLSKLGYQLPIKSIVLNNPKGGIEPESSWSNYTVNNPYIINAWKVEKYPKIKKNNRLFMPFEPDGRQYTLTVTDNADEFSEGNNPGDFYFSILKNKTGWKLNLSTPSGGFVEANDVYKYMAPEGGYKQSISFESENLKKRKYENLYFYSETKQLYGYLKLRINPNARNGKSSVVLKYVINLENGRNLTVKKSRAN